MSDTHSDVLSQAQALLPRTVQLRRQIHRHPELGNQLPQTRAAVLQAIGDLDLDLRLSAQTSGIVALLRGAMPGPTLLLRGDMDALPMPEDTGLEFASQVAGRMHACGHDSHTAMLASAARLLHSQRQRLHGQVVFMFQPGEEGPGGAQPMLDEGLLDGDARPDAAFALHIYPNLPSGVIACRPGHMLAAADTITVAVHGRGGHASMPHDANDPVPVLCEIVQALHTTMTRRFTPFEPVVFTVAQLQAGTVSNVIPEHATLTATLRTFSEPVRERAQTAVRELAAGIAAAHRMRAEVEIEVGYPPTSNHPAFVDLVRDVSCTLFGESGYHPLADPLMGAEDFSLVLARAPGAMAMLGVAPPGVDPAQAPPCHSNRMMLDEAAMARGIALHGALAMHYLAREH